ncbi:MAG: isoprenylcysteine carboxylmethyltransferase family protein [Acidobacteriota bacterium]
MMSAVLRRIARLRVTIGFVAAAVALYLASPTARTLAAGALVALVGEGMRVWAAGHLEKGREVTTSGPYALTRHPLYFGSTLIGIGLAIASASVVGAALVTAYLAVTLTAAIRTEEAHLTEKFGGAYPAYRDGTGAGGRRRFSPARAMRNREYRAVIGLAIALAVLVWKTRG